MTPSEISNVVEEAIRQRLGLQWWGYLIWLLLTASAAFLGSYFREKGRNTATKEDIANITRKVEEVKTEYVKDVEALKVGLSLISKKQSLLFDEKVRVFKKLQSKLVDFKKYCEASRGSLGYGGEFHQNLDSVPEEINKSALFYITAIHEIVQEDFIFLSENSKSAVQNLMGQLSTMASMELTLIGPEIELIFREGAISHYAQIMENIDACLLSLYRELEFPVNFQASETDQIKSA